MTSNWLSKPTITTSSRPRTSLSGFDTKALIDHSLSDRLDSKTSLPTSPLPPSVALSSAVTDVNGRRNVNLPSARQSNLTEYFRSYGSDRVRDPSNTRSRAQTELSSGKGKGREADWMREGIEAFGHGIVRSATPMSVDRLARGLANDPTNSMDSMILPSQTDLTKSSAASHWMKDGKWRLRPLSSEDEIDVKLELSPQGSYQQTRQEGPDFEMIHKRRKRSSPVALSKEPVASLEEAEDIGMESVRRLRSIKAERSVSVQSPTEGSTTNLGIGSSNGFRNFRESTSIALQPVPIASKRVTSPLFQTTYGPSLHLDQFGGAKASTHHSNSTSLDQPSTLFPSAPSSPLLSESLLPLLPASYPSPIQHSESLLRVFAPMGKDSAARLRMLRRDQFAWESDQAFAKRKRELAEVEARKAEEEKTANEKVRGVWEPPSRPSKKQRSIVALEKTRERPMIFSPGPNEDIPARGTREVLQEELEEEEEDAILQAITVSSATPGKLPKHNRNHHLSPIQLPGPLRVQGAPSPKRARPASSQQTYSNTQASENSSQTQSLFLPNEWAQDQPNIHLVEVHQQYSEAVPLQDYHTTQVASSSHSETHSKSQLPAMNIRSRSDPVAPFDSQQSPLSSTILDANQQSPRQSCSSTIRMHSDQILVEKTPTPPLEHTPGDRYKDSGPSPNYVPSSNSTVRDGEFEGTKHVGLHDRLVESSNLLGRSRSLSAGEIRETRSQSVSELYPRDSAVRLSVPSDDPTLSKRRVKRKEQQQQAANSTVLNEESNSSKTFVHSSVPFESSRWVLKPQSSSELVEEDEEFDRVEDSLEGQSKKGMDTTGRDQEMVFFEDQIPPVSFADDEIAVPSSQMNERLSPLRRLTAYPISPQNKNISLRIPRFPPRPAPYELASPLPSPSIQLVKPISTNKKRNSSSWNFSSLLAHPFASDQKAATRSSSPPAPLFSPYSSQTPPAKRRAKLSDPQLERRSRKNPVELQQSSLLAHFRHTKIPNSKRLARLHGFDEELDDVQPSDESNDEATLAFEKRDEKKDSGNLLEPGVTKTESALSSEITIPNSQSSPGNHRASFRKKPRKVMGRVPSPPPRDLLLLQLDSKPVTTRMSDPDVNNQNEDEDDVVPDSQFEEGKPMLSWKPTFEGKLSTDLPSGNFEGRYQRATIKRNVSAETAEDHLDRPFHEGRSSIRLIEPLMATTTKKTESQSIKEEGANTTITPDGPPTDDGSDPNDTIVPIHDSNINIFEPAELSLEASSLTSLSSDPISADSLVRQSDESISFWRFAAPSSDDPSA